MWTARLGQGYVGCLRDLQLNGRAVDLASYAKKQDSGQPANSWVHSLVIITIPDILLRDSFDIMLQKKELWVTHTATVNRASSDSDLANDYKCGTI